MSPPDLDGGLQDAGSCTCVAIFHLLYLCLYLPRTAESPSVPCCDICDPRSLIAHVQERSLRTSSRSDPASAVSPPRSSTRDLSPGGRRCSRAIMWELNSALRASPHRASISIGPVNKTKLHAILGTTWVWWEDYGDKLAAYMVGCNIPYMPIPRKGRTTQPRPPPQPRPVRKPRDKLHDGRSGLSSA